MFASKNVPIAFPLLCYFKNKHLCGVVTICDRIQKHSKQFYGIFVVITKRILVFVIWSVLTHENTRHVHRKGYNFIKKCFILIDLLVAVCLFTSACQSGLPPCFIYNF
jgi:hypothetical protein